MMSRPCLVDVKEVRLWGAFRERGHNEGEENDILQGPLFAPSLSM